MSVVIPAWCKLSALHLAFLGGICAYIWHFFPAEHGLVVAFAFAALAGELVSAWRRVFIAESLLIGAAAVSYLLWRPEAREQWHAFLGMLMAAWLLVPSRIGWLRWLVPLSALEMLYLGINVESPERVRHAAQTLVPLAVAALAADAWMVSTTGARSSVRNRPARFGMLRWALVPAVLALALGLGAGSAVTYSSRPMTHFEGKDPLQGKGLQPGLPTVPRIGEPGHITQDLSVAARINWEGNQPPPGVVYLRAMALPVARVEGDLIEWDGDGDESLVPVARKAPAVDHMAWVYRAAGGSDVILRPDTSDIVDLAGMVADREGNLFRTAFGGSPHVYRVSLGDEPRAVRPGPDNAYTFCPGKLQDLPWEKAENGKTWYYMKPEDAAISIAQWLATMCHYSLDLPKPAHSSGGVLRTFLFSDSEAERRGHCQYFATAEAMLLRRAKFASRLVVGFASDERDEQGVTFRGIHAHAWTEFVDSSGHWRRIDATPPGQLKNEWLKQSSGEEPPPPPEIKTGDKADAAETEPASLTSLSRSGWLPAALACLVLAWFARRWWKRRGLDPRRAELERRADDLFHFARGLGIAVTPAATVTTVTAALQARTGMDLARWRDAHLAARYGTGPVPAEWPYTQMKEAAKRKAGRIEEMVGR